MWESGGIWGETQMDVYIVSILAYSVTNTAFVTNITVLITNKSLAGILYVTVYTDKTMNIHSP